MEITIREDWAMGHRLPNHNGKCRNLHGHTYAVEVTLQGSHVGTPGTTDEGMVADFGIVKHALRKMLEGYDHRFLVHEYDPLNQSLLHLPGVVAVPYVPTAENIAAAMLQHLRHEINAPYDVVVSRLRLSESPTSWVDVS